MAAIPKSPGVFTSPRPKWCIQTRLTNTRAVSGWSLLVKCRAYTTTGITMTDARNDERQRYVVEHGAIVK